jgi:hypothetical protein
MADDDDLEPDDDLAIPDDTEDDQEQKPQGQTQDDEDVDQGEQEGDERIDVQDRRQPDQPPPSRRDRRIDTLIESNRQKDQQLSAMNQRIDALLQSRSQPQGETREQRDARRQAMSPEERMYDVLGEHTEAWGREKLSLQLGMADQMDKAAFEARCSVDKRYAKRQQAVEDKIREERARNRYVSREDAFRWVIGDEALKGSASQEVQAQRKDGAKRVRQQQVRPATNGSDVRADRGRQTSRERRLENVQI